MPETVSLSIILVNYKAPQLLFDCLRTIYAHPSSAAMEIIVVDNFSEDETEELLRKNYPAVKWIQMGYNSGFARANNAGIRASTCDTVLLLNSDTLNENDAIAECYQRFIASQYIAAGVQLLNTDRTPQITGNYFMKGGLNHLMALPYTGRVIRALGLLLKVKKTNVPAATGIVEVDWINGAFLMVKKTAIEKAGLLDEDFFLYSEEIEWCSRLRKAGKLCVYGDLHVVHLLGATASKAFRSESKGYTNLSDRKGFQLMLSGFVRIRKQFGVGWFLFHLLAHLFTIPIYFLLTILRTLVFFIPGIGKEWKDLWGFTKNAIGTARFLFPIIINQPFFYKVL